MKKFSIPQMTDAQSASPSSDFISLLKQKGLVQKTDKKPVAPLAMRNPATIRNKYIFRQDSPSSMPSVQVQVAPVRKSNFAYMVGMFCLLIVGALQTYSLYSVYKNINEMTVAKQVIPHDLLILRDLLIASTSLTLFVLIIFMFF